MALDPLIAGRGPDSAGNLAAPLAQGGKHHDDQDQDGRDDKGQADRPRDEYRNDRGGDAVIIGKYMGISAAIMVDRRSIDLLREGILTGCESRKEGFFARGLWEQTFLRRARISRVTVQRTIRTWTWNKIGHLCQIT